MKFRFILLLVLFFSQFYLSAEEINPWSLPIYERIVSRKNISNIVLETRPDHYRVTLILSDRFPYNYKGRSYAFFIKYEDVKEAMETAKSFDKHLDSGKEIYIYLDGSRIKSYKFL